MPVLRSGVILGIETSNPSAWEPSAGWMPGVALAELRGGALRALAREAIDPIAVRDDALVPAIDRAVRAAGLRPHDVAGVAVSIGPGGFTGVRIAVTAGKMIAEATGAACVGIPTAEVLARRVEHRGGAFGVALASKGDSVFLTKFRAGRPIEPGQATGPGALAGSDLQILVADRFLPESWARACAESGIEIRAPEYDALACIEAALGATPADPAALVPLYPREPEAVTKWRALHPPSQTS